MTQSKLLICAAALAVACAATCGMRFQKTSLDDRVLYLAGRYAKAGAGEKIEVVKSIVAEGEDAIPVLIALLESPEPATRECSAYSLGMFGQRAEVAIPALGKAAYDESDGVRWRAVLSLGAVGAESGRSLDPLIALIRKGPDPQFAADALAPLGERAAPAVPALRELLSTGGRWQRTSAIMALLQIGDSAETAIPDATRTLRDSESVIVIYSLRFLAARGPAARQAVPEICELIEAKSSAHDDILLEAVEALGKIGETSDRTRAALDLLEPASNPVLQTRVQAVRARLEARPPARTDQLVQALRDGSVAVRIEAARLASELGLTSPAIVTELGRLVQDEHPRVSLTAAEAIAQLEPAGPFANAAALRLAKAITECGEANPTEFERLARAAVRLSASKSVLAPSFEKYVDADDFSVRRVARASLDALR